MLFLEGGGGQALEIIRCKPRPPSCEDDLFQCAMDGLGYLSCAEGLARPFIMVEVQIQRRVLDHASLDA